MVASVSWVPCSPVAIAGSSSGRGRSLMQGSSSIRTFLWDRRRLQLFLLGDAFGVSSVPKALMMPPLLAWEVPLQATAAYSLSAFPSSGPSPPHSAFFFFFLPGDLPLPGRLLGQTPLKTTPTLLNPSA